MNMKKKFLTVLAMALMITGASYAQGFHSALSKKRFKELAYCNSSIYKCVIPKGSEYYENLSGLIVSNQIIIKNKI